MKLSQDEIPSPRGATPFAGSLHANCRWWIFFGLIAILGTAIYLPVRHFEFLNFDDGRFIADNPWLKHGLDWTGVQWAFSANLTEYSSRAEYWSPLTLLSRLADAQIYGINAGAFHVTSALIHLINAALLCAALYRLTGKWERSAFVALLFLAHPLNVEPACWLSARKDLLSATFFFLTLLAYSAYVERRRLLSYLAVLLAFAGCLMSKPMGVTIPFVLLILDWWPLGRWFRNDAPRKDRLQVVAEKVPLLMLAVGGAILAVVSQNDTGALQPSAALSAPVRIENALVSYAVYVRRIFWPCDLTLYYPHPGPSLPFWQASIAAAFLITVTAVVIALRRRAPYALAGWLWFGIVLGPVIGLVQIGGQAMADRYAYTSAIGIFTAIVWGAADRLKDKARISVALGAAAVLALTFCSMHQVLFWKDSITAFSRAVATTKNNGLAYLNLGGAYLAKGDLNKARDNYEKSLAIMPEVPLTWLDLGAVEAQLGNDDAALDDFHRALKFNPKYTKSLLSIARILVKRGQKEEAIPYLLQANELEPTWDEPYVTLGNLYSAGKRWKDAEQIWLRYLQLHPENEQVLRAILRVRAEQQKAN